MLNRSNLEAFISEQYGSDPEHPWRDYPGNTVFRHSGNRKWFALVMAVGRDKLGLAGEGAIDVLNVKCDPALIGSLLGSEGFLPAYHMNKTSWITVLLDGTVPDEKIEWLLDLSFDATAPRQKHRKGTNP